MTGKSAVDSAQGSYAVVRVSGRQYVMTAGEKVLVDRLDGNPGDEVTASEVLLISSGGETAEDSSDRRLIVGNPLVAGAAVKLRIVSHTKGPKIKIFKKKRRTGYTKRQGHRQAQTEVLVEDLVVAAQ